MLASALLLALLPAVLGFHDPAAHARSRARARAVHARHAASAFEKDETAALAKRDNYGGRATFYDVGLGACGWYNSASDYIVAQNSAQFGGSYPSPNCGKSITISYGGKTATAQIADECPSCGYGDLDFSRGLFDHFASEDLGEFQMTWWYNDGSGGQPTTQASTQAQPTTTSTSQYVAPTTSTSTYVYVAPTSTSTYVYVAPTSTSTYTPPTSTTTSTSTAASSSASPSSSSTSLSASSSNSSAIASASSSSLRPSVSILPDTAQTNATSPSVTASGSSGSPGPSAPQPTYADASYGNLVLFNQAVAYLGHIVVVGAGGK